MTTKKTSTKKAPEGRADNELDAFAYHLSEALRIARSADLITERFYNDLFGAWNEFAGSVMHNSHIWESADYIKLILADAERQQAEGGAE